MKAARFADVVKASGAPQTYLLWMPAKADKVFQRALSEHRVMTLHQELRGGKKDFGRVGFHEEPNAQYLIFPKSLRRFADRQVIGINYELFAKDERAHPAPRVVSRHGKSEGSLKTRRAARGKKEANVLAFTPPPDEPAAAKSDAIPKREPPSESLASTRHAAESKGFGPKAEGKEGKAKSGKIDRRFVAEVEKTMKELRAGKPVAAYQRLETLLRHARSAAGD